MIHKEILIWNVSSFRFEGKLEPVGVRGISLISQAGQIINNFWKEGFPYSLQLIYSFIYSVSKNRQAGSKNE